MFRRGIASAVGEKVGWLMGIEPTTPRSTTWCSNRLSYSHRKKTRLFNAWNTAASSETLYIVAF